MEAKGQKKILLSEAHRKENLYVADYLLKEGHLLALLSKESQIVNDFIEGLDPEHRHNCFVQCLDHYRSDNMIEAVDSAADKLKGLDILINGLPGVANEAVLLESLPETFGRDIVSGFNEVFLLNREIVRRMIREKAGNIMFLLIDDVLDFADYPASPVHNHGILAMMKSMAKELTPFNIRVNSLTFGIHNRDFSPSEKREMRRKLEFCALKPPIPIWEDLLPALDALIYPSFSCITGQNYPACIGTST
ncbi:MAG: hypothetical protein APF77_17195 [Clostridia bacterium BRH_c25]|nr:MAG: hypothetical protein APF77_17195 [Clostridia bacterium BRH_c25]